MHEHVCMHTYTHIPFLQEVLQDEPGQMGFVAPEEEARWRGCYGGCVSILQENCGCSLLMGCMARLLGEQASPAHGQQFGHGQPT